MCESVVLKTCFGVFDKVPDRCKPGNHLVKSSFVGGGNVVCLRHVLERRYSSDVDLVRRNYDSTILRTLCKVLSNPLLGPRSIPPTHRQTIHSPFLDFIFRRLFDDHPVTFTVLEEDLKHIYSTGSIEDKDKRR